MDGRSSILVCFAVREETAACRDHLQNLPHVRTLLTGIGRAKADRSIRPVLERYKPSLVLTCGFTGGLDPKFKIGDVLFDEDAGAGLGNALRALGAVPAKFHCADRVAVTALEKSELRRTTGADAVEMESSVIRALCRERSIPSATIRVISDTADKDLPLDFNALMNDDGNISMTKLGGALLKSPGKIPRLMELQRDTRLAAGRLAEVLEGLLRTVGSRGAD